MPPIKTLDKLRKVLDPKPLKLEQLAEFFVETDEARDPTLSRRDEIAEILLEGSTNAKILFAGHNGTGKSTELVKFRSDHQDKLTFIELSIITDGDPAKVNVEGLLVLIAEAVLRQMNELGLNLSENHLERIYKWFDETFEGHEKSHVHNAEVGGGLDMKESYMAKLLGLTGTLKTGIRSGSATVSKTIRKVENNLPDLVSHCGTLLKEAELAVFENNADSLVLVIEDLDKIPIDKAIRLFIDNPAPLAGLPVRAVLTAPVFLFFNPRASILDSHFERVTMPMIKIMEPGGQRYERGWVAIRKILAQRVELESCIDDDALELAVEKTGGVLRHLFQTLRTAALAAGQDFKRGHRDVERINQADVRYGLDRMKSNLIDRIGVMGLPDEFDGIETADLYERLKVFRKSQRAPSNRVNLLLMQADALLEYNGSRWHRAHPLILEYLDELESPPQEA